MNKKYTTITIPYELSVRVRQYALNKRLRTGEVIKMALDRLFIEDTVLLYNQIDDEIGNKPKTYNLEIDDITAKAIDDEIGNKKHKKISKKK
jgi:post-segregation antitoxin (ccd killing protein)